MKKIFILLFALLAPRLAFAQTAVKVDFGDTPKPEKGNLEKLLDEDTIGKNYRKLSKILGTAVSVNGRKRDYIIDNCKVRLWVFRNEGRVNPQYDGIIEAVETEISPVCTFKFTDIFHSLSPQKTANEIIIKDISKPETEFYSKCFVECGEAKFEPVEFRYGLKKEDGYLAIDFIIDPILNEQSAILANKISSDFKAGGAKISDDINCDQARNKAAIKAFEDQKITRIRFGMEDMDRENLPSCKVAAE